MGVETIKVPDVGSSDPVDVIEVSVKVGDSVDAEETILVLESDKASIEVPAPVAGTVSKVLVKVGDRVKEGDPLMDMDTAAGGDSAAAEASKPDAEPKQQAQPPAAAEKAAEKQAEKPASSAGQQSEQRVPVPDLGDIDGAELIEFAVAEGDTVAAEDVLAVLESDKASLEIPAPTAGTITALLARVGDKLSSGDDLLRMAVSGDDARSAEASGETGGSAADTGKASPPPTTQSAPGKGSSLPSAQNTDAPAPATSGKAPSAPVHAGPAVRKLARELGVDLAAVTGTGVKGRIIKDDLHAHVKQRLEQGSAGAGGTGLPALPEIDFSRFGDVERVELNKLRKVSAANLHRSWVTIPHVAQHDNADITDLEAFRQSQNQRLKKDLPETPAPVKPPCAST